MSCGLCCTGTLKASAAPATMKLRSKLLLSLGVVLISTFTVVEYFGYQHTRAQLVEDLRKDAIHVRDILVAIRNVYQQQFLASGIPLNKKTVGFLPAHSMSRISRDFLDRNDSGLVFKNVSDDPRNPDNQADEIELKAMAFFRENRDENERLILYKDEEGRSFYHYSSPLWVESHCLKCHGDNDDAPATIRESYTEAFGYRLGELRGLMSIKLPSEQIEQEVLNQQINKIWGHALGFLVVYLVGMWLVNRWVIRRLARIRSVTDGYASGDFSHRLDIEGNDELCQLANAFNEMADHRQDAERLQVESEQQVRDLLNSTAEAIYGIDTEGNCIFANPACLRMLGYRSIDDLIGQNMHSLIHHSRTDGSPYPEENSPITSTTYTGASSHVDSEVFWRADGTSFPVEYWSHPVLRDGQVIGVVATFLDITKRKAQEEHILHQAHFDALTDLPNRFLSMDRVSQALIEAERDGSHVAVLFLDLDDFKKINDTLGHDAGDKLLLQAARRLRVAVRSGDTVGRLGGDEFIVLLGGRLMSVDVSTIVDNLLNHFRQPFSIDGRDLYLTTSVGVALYPEDGTSPQELLRNADSAMYHAKKQGRNTYSYFTEAMNEEVSRRLHLEEQMHGALDRGEFNVVFQPLVDVASSKVVSAEALLRWKSHALGDITPDEFIPVAEQTGLIVQIGQFVLSRSLEALADWRANIDSELAIAVNLSPRQFRDPHLVSSVEKMLQQQGLPGHALKLEITEGVLMTGHGYVNEAISEINRLGIGVCMDDFGTGYSSLSYLRRYPFDVLKIDRSFINDISDDTADLELVSASVAMAHGLGLTVVAEGVETMSQLELLTEMGCDEAQGYLFSRPCSAEKIRELLIQGISIEKDS